MGHVYIKKKAKNDYLNIMSSNACFWLKKKKKLFWRL